MHVRAYAVMHMYEVLKPVSDCTCYVERCAVSLIV